MFRTGLHASAGVAAGNAWPEIETVERGAQDMGADGSGEPGWLGTSPAHEVAQAGGGACELDVEDLWDGLVERVPGGARVTSPMMLLRCWRRAWARG